MKFCTWPNILIPIIIQIHLNRSCRVVCNLASFQNIFPISVFCLLRFVILLSHPAWNIIWKNWEVIQKLRSIAIEACKPLRYQHPITLQIYQIPFLNRHVLHTLPISITEFSGNAAFVAKCGQNVIVDATRYIFILSIEERKYNILLFQRLKHQ